MAHPSWDGNHASQRSDRTDVVLAVFAVGLLLGLWLGGGDQAALRRELNRVDQRIDAIERDQNARRLDVEREIKSPTLLKPGDPTKGGRFDLPVSL